MYRKGDVVLVYAGRSPLGRLIKWGTRSKGEAPTRISHVAIIINDAVDAGEAYAVGAEWRVRQRKVKEWPVRLVVRRLGLAGHERSAVAQRMVNSMGRKYGWWQYVTFVLDEKLLGGETRFRRLTRSVKRPVCSTLAAWAYSQDAGVVFVRQDGREVPWYAMTPDDWDDITQVGSEWDLVEDAS